jgi:restriction system protein
MSEVYFVRANYGQYAEHFLNGGYVAIGWLEETDLSQVESRDELYPMYADYHQEQNTLVLGQQVGQIARFLFDINPGDYVLTAPANTEFINWGIVQENPYYFGGTEDGCPFPHRKRVKWHPKPIRRAEFSVPFQNTIKSSLTVYWVKHRNNFFEVIGETSKIPKKELKTAEDNYDVVLNRLLELDHTEFEILITHLLTALGFEAQHTGKTNDGGVDALGVLNIANMATVKLFVQVKRYSLHSKVNPSQVKALRQSIPNDGQGAFITTSDFQAKALEVATELNFTRIGTVNGKQLVDILVDKWEDLPDDFKEKLGLKLGLVIS